MIKNITRNIANKFGYDFIKTVHFKHGQKNKRKSDDPSLDYYETALGGFYLPKENTGDVVSNSIKTGKIYDQEIIKVAERYIKPDTSIIDIGANYGQMSIEFARAHSTCRVYSFEAQLMVHDILKKNIEKNNIKNVEVFYNAVYDKNNLELIFPVPDLKRFPSYSSYGLDLNAESGIPVKSITIDSVDFELPVSFMKVDIQGSDLAAMRGAVETIRKYQMPVIFEYEEQFQKEFGTTFQDYVEFVDSIGYKFVETVQEINYLIMPKN